MNKENCQFALTIAIGLCQALLFFALNGMRLEIRDLKVAFTSHLQASIKQASRVQVPGSMQLTLKK